MVPITSFAVHVTYTCPLACAHCCFSSDPSNKDRLPINHIMKAIEVVSAFGIKMVAFTGGELFLLGKNLVTAVALASRKGITPRVVTSAHWATTERIAEQRLIELKEAGLSELSISWDDYHEEFVSFENVRRAFSISKKLGITTAISIVQASTSKWTADRVRQELGNIASETDVIVESPLNQTGRASEVLTKEGVRDRRFIGPCPYVLTGPTLSAKNKLLACCGVIPETEDLVIDSNPSAETINASIDRARRSALFNWLYLRGPYALMEYIQRTFNVDIPKLESIGGNCEACKILFETPAINRYIRISMMKKSEQISSELQILDSLGLLSSDGVMGLWTDGKTCVDTGLYRTTSPSSHGEDHARAENRDTYIPS